MYRYLQKISYTLLVLFFSFLISDRAEALILGNISDTMSVQHAGQYSDHTIVFEVSDGVVLGEQIELVFNGFDLGNLTAADITMLTGGAASGSRSIDPNWSLLSGPFSSGDTSFQVEFLTNYPAGIYIEFQIGGSGATNKILNPAVADLSYDLNIHGVGSTFAKAGAQLPIINDAVGVYAKIISPSGPGSCVTSSCLFDKDKYTFVRIEGWTHHKGLLYVYHRDRIIATTYVGADGFFSFELNNFTEGRYTFYIRAFDDDGLQAPLFTISENIIFNSLVVIDDILLAPTIDLYSINQNGNGHVHGDTIPFAFVDVYQDGVLVATVQANELGHWSYNFRNLAPNQTYLFTAIARINGLVSPRSYTEPARYAVFVPPLPEPVLELVTPEGEVFTKETICLRGDVSGDGVVSLQDMSAASYWRNTRGTVNREGTVARNRENHCLNNDRDVDLKDYSIMSYYWKETWSAIKWLREGVNKFIPFRRN